MTPIAIIGRYPDEVIVCAINYLFNNKRHVPKTNIHNITYNDVFWKFTFERQHIIDLFDRFS